MRYMYTRYHYELNFCPLRSMTLNDVIEKYDLRQFHCDIILRPELFELHNNNIIMTSSHTFRPECLR